MEWHPTHYQFLVYLDGIQSFCHCLETDILPFLQMICFSTDQSPIKMTSVYFSRTWITSQTGLTAIQCAKMYVNACAEYIKLNPLPRPSHNCTYVGSCLRECLPTSTSLSDPGLNAKNLCTKTPWSYILQPRKPLPNAHLPSLSQSGVHKSSMESI